MTYDPKTYDWWRAQLRAQATRHMPDPLPEPELDVGVAYPGHYRKQDRSGAFVPVSVWRAPDGADETLARVGLTGKVVLADAQWCEDVFSWCCRKAISQKEFEQFRDTGLWSDSPPPKVEKPGSNLPENFRDALLERLIGEEAEAERFLKEPIRDQTTCDRAANWAARVLNDIEQPAEATRAKEKQPHLDEAKAVDDLWVPIRDRAKALKVRLKKATEDFLRGQKRKALEAAQAKNAETLQKAGVDPSTSGRQPYVERIGAKAGTIGARTSLRTYRSAVIENPAAFAAWLVENNNLDLLETMDKIANRMARVEAQAPGIRIITEERAA